MNASPDLSINTDLARRILTGFIQSEITRMGFTRAVINLSGGIDSALSCFLAAEALGPQNVLAIRLPYKASSPDSLEHAQLVIDATGVTVHHHRDHRDGRPAASPNSPRWMRCARATSWRASA